MNGPTDEITTREAADLLGFVSTTSIIRMVNDRRLVPSRKLPTKRGAYLFWRADVLRYRNLLEAQRAAK